MSLLKYLKIIPMKDDKYAEAIELLKQKYPQYKDVKFDISNGVLGYIRENNSVNIDELQKFVNEILGQKVFRAEFTTYLDVYARSREEVQEFISKEKGVARTSIHPNKITETDLHRTYFTTR